MFAISSILVWIPIILSAISVAVAIYVPWKIAKKQNQLAVFDKLFEAYSALLCTKNFADAIASYRFTADIQASKQLRELFCIHFETDFGYHPDTVDYAKSIGLTTAALRKNECQAYMIPVLISKDRIQRNECSQRISAIYEPLLTLATEVIMFNPSLTEDINVQIREFVNAIYAFFDKYSGKIEDLLLCGK